MNSCPLPEANIAGPILKGGYLNFAHKSWIRKLGVLLNFMVKEI
jgi:hypothetical protein